jgi:hypothetical protein
VSTQWSLDDEQLARVCGMAAILLPGSPGSPAPGALPEFGQLVQRAVATVGRESAALEAAIGRLPLDLSWESLEAYADAEAEGFELVALVVVGAYFMSPTVLTAIGLPTDDRRAAPRDQAVDELGSGILDAVLERGSPVKTLPEVNGWSDT